MTSNDPRPAVKLDHHAEAHGPGPLTADLLLQLVHQLADSGVPPQAEITLRAERDGRDGTSSWRIAASW